MEGRDQTETDFGLAAVLGGLVEAGRIDIRSGDVTARAAMCGSRNCFSFRNFGIGLIIAYSRSLEKVSIACSR